MSDFEIPSLSPDGRYQVQAIPWGAGNTHWLFPPQIIDTQNGNVVFGFEDHLWSADRSTWLSPTRVELKLRKYPGLEAQGFIIQDTLRISRQEFDAVLLRDGSVWNVQCKNNFVDLKRVGSDVFAFAR